MPKLTYTPEGAEPKVWEFTFGKIKFGERDAVEKATGLGWQGVQDGFWANRANVIHAFLWVLLKREIPTLRASEVDFVDDEIEVDVTDDEGKQVLAGLVAKKDLDEEEARMFAVFSERFGADATAASDDEPAEDPDPKGD